MHEDAPELREAAIEHDAALPGERPGVYLAVPVAKTVRALDTDGRSRHGRQAAQHTPDVGLAPGVFKDETE
jgi:hypothetical protein